MATKSFTSEFKFNRKSSSKLADAIDNSKRIDRDLKQTVNDIVHDDKIQKIMKNFLGEN